MKISIFGLGYVGCVGVGCFARRGHQIIGVDPQASKVEYINSGRPTIIEKGIDELMAEQHAAGRISATADRVEAVRLTELSFICVGTPPTRNGHLDLSAINRVAEDIGRGLKTKTSRHVIAIRSTVLPGTNEKVSEIIARISGRTPGVDFAVVSNPEFLREGTSIEDFENPPFTLLGSDHEWAIEVMRAAYAGLSAPVIVAVPRVAELMKYVCNSFHALKITFANEVGNICHQLGIDGQQVMEIFCRDTKLNISRAYLKPGFAYGGSCLPKDLKALQTIAHDHYLSCPVLESIERSNEHQKELALKEIQRHECHKVAFLGLSFKPGTDDLRESPIIDVIERLLGKGYDIQVYDRHVHLSRLVGANREYILQKIPFISRFISDNLESVIAHADLIVVVNKEPGLKEALLALAGNKPIYDLANLGLNRPAIAATPPAANLHPDVAPSAQTLAAVAGAA
ncbi:MAG TPA: UDP-glucose/GDP-mannose dehydrogenase family protein [Opitutaceae bacterium]|nr:UDP-glucose/GDP-mannose dehydrogenase family protein [Opitutaceae bacterium]